MKRLRALFQAHPASVGETYGEHLVSAWGFAFRMIAGGIACFLHGLLPFLCITTGSRVIARLHQRMVLNRSKLAPAARNAAQVER